MRLTRPVPSHTASESRELLQAEEDQNGSYTILDMADGQQPAGVSRPLGRYGCDCRADAYPDRQDSRDAAATPATNPAINYSSPVISHIDRSQWSEHGDQRV